MGNKNNITFPVMNTFTIAQCKKRKEKQHKFYVNLHSQAFFIKSSNNILFVRVSKIFRIQMKKAGSEFIFAKNQNKTE